MKTKLLAGAACAALLIPRAAFAQSTGTADAESHDVVVTGTRQHDVGGTQIPDTPKTRAVLDQKFISQQVPGQSINEIINQLPGVSFQNNDPYGGSGGRLTIRGFGPDRISETVDGVPINDTGNYALYSNELLDPELIEQVSVTLGSTDIDSPTASATGSTVNFRSLIPTDEYHARMEGSIGDLNYFRLFGIVNTGVLDKFGTKAWISASHSNYNEVYSSFGKEVKDGYNAKIYQPLRDNGDFISLAGSYYVIRNNNEPDVPLRTDRAVPNGFPLTADQRYFTSPRCLIAVGVTGVADVPNTCGTAYEQNVNPTNIGVFRVNSKYSITDNLVLTVDPSFQYIKANGGSYGYSGSERATPGSKGAINIPAGLYGYLGGTIYTGDDLNGDGDRLDRVEVDATSQTVTHRYILESSLRWDLTPTNSFRLAYTHDYGRHRQTGEVGLLQPNGQPAYVFPINNPLLAVNGAELERRNRKSFAILDQVSGEYRGKFFDEKLVVNAGLRAPFFKRDLNQYCFTVSGSGSVDCVAGTATDVATYAAANPYVYTPAAPGGIPTVTGSSPPQSRNYSYNKILPSAGLTYRFSGEFQLYASYSKGLQVPGTDALYNAMYYPQGVQNPLPETSDNFDAGVRYNTSKIQAFVGPWYTKFHNRIAQFYDPLLDVSTYTNLGNVTKWGIDGSVAYQPVRVLSLYAFGSYLHSKIESDVFGGLCSAANVTYAQYGCTTANARYYLPTAGKRESGAPIYTFGGRAQLNFGSFEIGGQAKRTGPRYVNDSNLPLYTGVPGNAAAPATSIVYGAEAKSYTVVDLDARVSLGFLGLNKKTYFQINVTNVFDKLYVGNLGNGNISPYNSIPYVYIGPPRTVSGTLNVEF